MPAATGQVRRPAPRCASKAESSQVWAERTSPPQLLWLMSNQLTTKALLAAARRQDDLHAGVDIEGLGHRLVDLIDRKFVGDELFQRIGCLELVQETQAARVAGRGRVGHAAAAHMAGAPTRLWSDGH